MLIIPNFMNWLTAAPAIVARIGSATALTPKDRVECNNARAITMPIFVCSSFQTKEAGSPSF
jgi:hypothetical protein